MTDPLQGFGVSMEDMKAEKEARRANARDNGVCVCGHAARAHTEKAPEGQSSLHDSYRAAGVNRCVPSKIECGCKKYHQVLVVQDLRKFKHTTRGPGAGHALTQGIYSSAEAGKSFEWLSNVGCFKCKRLYSEEGVQLAPIAYYAGGREASTSTEFNMLMCVECRAEVARTAK